MRITHLYATLWLSAFAAATAALELKGWRNVARGLQMPPKSPPPLKKVAKASLEEPLVATPTTTPAAKANKEVVFKQDKAEFETGTAGTIVRAPSAVPIRTTTLNPTIPTAEIWRRSPTASPTIAAFHLGTSNNQVEWTLALDVEPPLPRQVLQDAVTEYLGVSSARLTLIDDSNDVSQPDGYVFTVHSADHKVLDHQQAILDRSTLESFLRHVLRRTDIQVITTELDNHVRTVANAQPNKVIFVLFIVSLFAIGTLLAVVLYVVPYLQLRRDYEQEWTFSEEREARVWQGTSA